ncbi:hypothetical protein [Streptomyces lateritius]|uniref:hypothetical protein n=1 Tax=Streptomyces lateritius TaxID=67313 RepID=UPI00167B1794|nr:hypothetical protein [Streptomyces lateritius]GGU11770.1 hypothetical protein GCM10010272_66140 [Streptomyces lateritius]
MDLEVHFRRIAVSKISDPGSNAEVEFTLAANGQTQKFVDNDLRIGITPINRTFLVRVPPTSTLDIAVGGVEKDVSSADDPLPGFVRRFGAANNFGLGVHSIPASNTHMTYLMDFEVRPAPGLLTSLTGTATLTTTDDRARGPFTTPITVELFFNDPRTEVSISSIPPVTVQTGNGPVTVTHTGGGNGTFDKNTGTVRLPAGLHFDLPFPASDSSLPLTLTTGRAGGLIGTPLNRTTGGIRLVGAATFTGGTLAGKEGTLAVDGELTELP